MGLASKNLNGNQRNEFNRDICTLISTHTTYPTETERQIIAQKIVAKYPFLKDPKIGSTSTEWVRLSVYKIWYYITSCLYSTAKMSIMLGGQSCQSNKQRKFKYFTHGVDLRS